MSGKWLLAAAGAVVVGAVVGVVSLLVEQYDLLPSQEPDTTEAAQVAVEPIRLTGVVVPLNVVGVPAPVEGSLESVVVAIGDQVYEGQLLGRILNTSFAAEMEAAQEDIRELEEEVYDLERASVAAGREATDAENRANVARDAYLAAEREYLRSQNLLEKGATPRLEHDKVKADYDAKQSRYQTLEGVAEGADARLEGVEAQLDMARSHLKDAEAYEQEVAGKITSSDVLAPVDGVLAGMAARPGDEVHPEAGDLFAIATDLLHLAVILDPDPSVARQLRPGQRAVVQIPALPTGRADGEVVFTESRIEVQFLSPTTAVVPGSTAHVVIPLA